jgi:hypothetical protein
MAETLLQNVTREGRDDAFAHIVTAKCENYPIDNSASYNSVYLRRSRTMGIIRDP